TLCFTGIRDTLEAALADLLWPSYREVRVRRHGDELEPGDYLLQVELTLDALPPDASRYGWSAGAKGRWRIVRDGLPIKGEALSTRSGGDFAYGSGLGEAAGEVVEAVAALIAHIVVRLPEPSVAPPDLLPPVVAKDSFAPASERARGTDAKLAERPADAEKPAQSATRAKSDRCGRRPLLFGGCEALFDRFEVCVDLRVFGTKRFDATHRAHDRRVIAVAEGPPKLWKAALQPLPTEVHRHLTREGDALVAIFAQ